MAGRQRSPWFRRHMGGAAARLVAAGGLALSACSVAGDNSALAPMRVYVANSADETITVLDAETLLPIGPAFPGGPVPQQIVAGPNGTVLAVSALSGTGGVQHISPSGDRWLAAPIRLEAAAADAVAASDGLRQIAVAYRIVPATVETAPSRLASTPTLRSSVRQPSRCRLALIDARTGTVQDTLTPCANGERVTGVALSADPTQTQVYVTISGDTSSTLLGQFGRRDRVAVLDAGTGKSSASRGLEGVPSHLAAAPAIRGRPQWLYVVQEPPPRRVPNTFIGPPGITGPAGERQLLRLRPDTLQIDQMINVGATVDAIEALDASTVYLLQGDLITRVTPATGAVQRVAKLPDRGHDMAITPHWIFVTHPEGGDVWVVDRRTGKLVHRIATGGQPLGVSAALA